MDANPQDLVRAALEAAKGAYAPYSRFRVGAALVAASGRVYTGYFENGVIVRAETE